MVVSRRICALPAGAGAVSFTVAVGRPWLGTVDALRVIDSIAAGADGGGGGGGCGAGVGAGVGAGAGVGVVGVLPSHADADRSATRRNADDERNDHAATWRVLGLREVVRIAHLDFGDRTRLNELIGRRGERERR